MTLLKEQISKQRKLVKLTQEELAQKSGLSLSSIRDLEKGRNINPTISVIIKLNKSLNFKIKI